MEINYQFFLHVMNWASEDEIENNNIGAFQTSNSNTPVYYIVRFTGNAYTLQGKYTCHAYNLPVMIPEGELICPAKFMTTTRKTPYCVPIMNEGSYQQILYNVMATYMLYCCPESIQ